MNTLDSRRSGRREARRWAALRAADRTGVSRGRRDGRRVNCLKGQSGASELGILTSRYDGLAAIKAAVQAFES
jgi:hypothetical protein